MVLSKETHLGVWSFLFLFAFGLMHSQVSAQVVTTSWTVPGTAANVKVGGDKDWKYVDNIKTANSNAWARAKDLKDLKNTEALRASDFGFNIPANATITGIEVEISRDAEHSGRLSDLEVSLMSGGALLGSNKATSTLIPKWTNLAASLANYGDSSDLWDTTWTPAQLNATDFGVSYRVEDSQNSKKTEVYVSYIRLRVSYITNNPPVINVTSPSAALISIPAGDTVNFNWAATDSDAGDSVTSATWRPTASSSYANATGSLGVGPFSASYAYNTIGAFTATLTATDANGATSNQTVQIQVYNSSLNCANQGTAANQDWDCDGVINSSDVDDDNDGVLDEDEYNFGPTINVHPADFGLAPPAAPIDPNDPPLPPIIYSGTYDASANLGLPAGTVTITYTNAGVSRTTAGQGIFNVPAGTTSQFVVTSTYPLLFRPGMGKSFNNAGDTRGISANDAKAYNFTSTPINGATHVQAGNTYTMTAAAAGDGVSNSNIIWEGEEVATSFDLSYFATGTGANFRTTFRVPADTDGDGFPDFLDKDSDDDGITDIIEAGGVDTDNDGEVDYPTPGDPLSMEDENNSGVGNGWSDIHDDDLTLTTPGTPLADADSDSDTYKDRVDIDSDNDGILDNIEAQPTASFVVATGMDRDGDGIDNAYDVDDVNGAPLNPTNTDGTDNPDYLDLDSDNDGLADVLEAWDSDADGVAEYTATGTDVDNDGLDDAFDPDFAASIAQIAAVTANTDPTTMYGYIAGAEPNWRNGLIYVFPKVFLEGPYDASTHLMTTHLCEFGSASILAKDACAQPYNVAPWNYAGSETVDSSFFATHTDITDWVLIELRDKSADTNIIYRKAAFVKADGSVVDIDGTPGVLCEGISADDYFISVRHRNHLGVMGNATVYLDSDTAGNVIDFTTTATVLFGDGTAAAEVEPGIQALHMGNAFPDNIVKFTGSNNDKAAIGLRVNSSVSLINTYYGYCFEDIDLSNKAAFTGSGNDKAKNGKKLKTVNNLLNTCVEQLP